MSAQNATFRIAVYPGDGIGIEIMAAARRALRATQDALGGFELELTDYECGAGYYRDSGEEISEAAFEAGRAADAILLGAIGLPDVRKPDGTEISPHLRMRAEFGLYGGVRPVKLYPNVKTPLADPRAQGIDLVILRESTEGLFASVGKGRVIDDREAREELVITRPVTERLVDLAIDIARGRQGRPGADGPGRVTCVDKANVFAAYAFFRKIYDERMDRAPDLARGYAYVDAAALDLVRKPWTFDVMVMENMFGDILSDLAGGLVGGMGMAPCAEIGDAHALFQPAHGTAPDIAGKGIANPSAMLVSAAMMLDWLGRRHDAPALRHAGRGLERALEIGFADGTVRPVDLGGDVGTEAITDAVVAALPR
ncbi:MAG: isocitrate/isopropylmalate family dehydrogenase, partial [Alphaproteobacteria bacterium]